MNKVIVIYDDYCRMGNRMFAYAFGKILAEAKAAEFYALPLPNFPETLNEKHPQLIKSCRNVLYTRETYGNNWVDYQALINE